MEVKTGIAENSGVSTSSIPNIETRFPLPLEAGFFLTPYSLFIKFTSS
jgi:hypothetical protein